MFEVETYQPKVVSVEAERMPKGESDYLRYKETMEREMEGMDPVAALMLLLEDAVDALEGRR